MHRILTVIGARPQFVKAAPLSRALTRAGLKEVVIHTGQHFDDRMSRIFFDELDIPSPTLNLNVNSLGHGAMTGRMLEHLEQVILDQRPELVLIYGDTNSTLAGALAASKLHVPVAHVEAGLRSFNRKMPEEINRVVADHLSTLLFCPTATAVANLALEGITNGVHSVGDVMYDATLSAIQRAAKDSSILNTLGLRPRSYIVCTVHRAENTDDPSRFERILDWIIRCSADTDIIMPVHPRTKRLLQSRELPASMRVIEALGYLDMTQLVHHANSVITDSGGLQKEAYFHRVPCVTLRDETEWIETIEAGWNRLWINRTYATPRREIPDYGNGDAATKIATLVREFLENCADRLPPVEPPHRLTSNRPS